MARDLGSQCPRSPSTYEVASLRLERGISRNSATQSAPHSTDGMVSLCPEHQRFCFHGPSEAQPSMDYLAPVESFSLLPGYNNAKSLPSPATPK